MKIKSIYIVNILTKRLVILEHIVDFNGTEEKIAIRYICKVVAKVLEIKTNHHDVKYLFRTPFI